ncbi:hypothetical protein D1632_01720 [Chryseobacterium nematophagum]|uniref:Uncharacterized protein n=1 Tax=Chryseobacterium nematophagum TaxID=2305228 RepID=A0A3M7LF49_9FLAO|nr:hypothetical protein [Chryseobacterium nematophagum]RMZ60724.1 hypothetical protein D1632_01720 [Chryseobacterium nematophagum]
MKSGLSIGFIFLLFFIINCTKKEMTAVDVGEDTKAHYDTTAIDSFSVGATSVDIVRKIKMSSKKYQDSIKEAAARQMEEKRIKDELEKENKKKLEEEKKKNEENSAKKSTGSTQTITTE